MPVVEQSVTIASPPEVVFEYLNTAETVPLWDHTIVAVEQLSSPLQVGTRLRGTSAMMGRRMNWVTEVVEFNPPVHMVSKTVEGKVDFTVSFDLSPIEGGSTLLTFRVDAKALGDGLFGRFVDSFIERMQTKSARANLERLVEQLADQRHTSSGR